MSARNERTGKRAASKAGKTLADSKASKRERSAAASALAQVGNRKQTGKVAASKAGKVLADPNASKEAKSAAASTLTQRSGKSR